MEDCRKINVKSNAITAGIAGSRCRREALALVINSLNLWHNRARESESSILGREYFHSFSSFFSNVWAWM